MPRKSASPAIPAETSGSMRPGSPTGKVTSNVSSRGSGGKLRETHASISTAKVAKPTHQRSARREGRAGVVWGALTA